jgi:hypothetical protein
VTNTALWQGLLQIGNTRVGDVGSSEVKPFQLRDFF